MPCISSSPSRRVGVGCQHPSPPPPVIPKWTHTFFAESNSSDRVRAASVAYMAKQQHPKDTKNSSRISDVDCKKAAKQEKFLSVVQHSDVNVALLNAADIRNEVIVFDGTSSHPPPPIYPPPEVSTIIIILWLMNSHSTLSLCIIFVLETGVASHPSYWWCTHENTS